MDDFPFTIDEIASLLQIRIRKRNTVSFDADCPFCGEKKGKMNVHLKKNVFKCNRCGESGGRLDLFGKLYGIDNATAYRQISEALGKGKVDKEYRVTIKAMPEKEKISCVKPAADAEKNRTYEALFSLLLLSDFHKGKLLERGFSEEQIIRNGYKSTPAFGYRSLVKKLLENGYQVMGVPGFYQEENGEWSINLHAKASGIMIPVRNIDGLLVGVQIRQDRPYQNRKYIWLSSVNQNMGVSSGSPIHFVGEVGAGTLFVTEGPLKGDLSYALSGRSFGCVPGANQYSNLPDFLKQMKMSGTRFIYESYDMDKLLKLDCYGDYNDKCFQCEWYGKYKKYRYICPKKEQKRINIQRGCQKLREICDGLQLQNKMLTWDMDQAGDWAGKLKGVDDYLYDIEVKKNKA